MADPLGLINSAASVSGSVTPVPPTGPRSPQGPGAEPAPSFKEVLLKNIEQVNQLQQHAAMAIEDLASGKRDDLDAVLMAKQRADAAFQLLLQVRNKLMDAYEQVKQIRV